VSRWQRRVKLLHQRLRSHVARPEPSPHAVLSLPAVLREIPRTKGWQIAEHARRPHPSGIPRLLSRATWGQDGVRDVLRSFVCQSLTSPSPSSEGSDPPPPFPVGVVDERGFPTRGRHAAGVGPQECGRTAPMETCQVGVFLSSVTEQGHALSDRERSLPEDWCSELPRRHAAHIPDAVGFQTTVDLAQRMIQRAPSARVPIRWVVADPVSGHRSDLRHWLHEQGSASAGAVPCPDVLSVHTPAGASRCAVGRIASSLHRRRDGQRLSQSLGTTGERLCAWAMLPWLHAGREDGRHVLVIRRCLDDPGHLAASLVVAPLSTPVSTIVPASGARWRIEEDREATTDLGLDQEDVRSVPGWSRHVTLVWLADAFLVGVCVQDRLGCSPQNPPAACSPLIPLTPSAVRHLLARLLFCAPASAPRVGPWSHVRCTHQEWAGSSHRRRREKACAAGFGNATRAHQSPGSVSSCAAECSWECSLECSSCSVCACVLLFPKGAIP
jgi:SRSO17 transposase